MNKKNTKLEILGSMPIPRALLVLGLPNMVGMLINALYNLADTYFVGDLGTDQMGAITIVYPLGQIIIGLGLLFGAGAAANLSRLLGRGDFKAADKVVSTAIYSSVVTGAIIIIISVIFLKPILRQLGALESMMPYAVPYAGIYIVFSIFNVFNVTMNNIVSSEGAAKTGMLALLAGAVLNVILDPILIYSLDMGVTGAAVATAISQFISACVYLIYILKKSSLFSFSIREYSFTGGVFREILKIGIPVLTFQILTSVSISMINSAANDYGSSALAAMGPVTKIMSVGSLVVFGFLKGFQPIAGYSYGAKNYGRLQEAIRTAVIWSTAFGIMFCIIAVVFSNGIMSQFTKDDMEMVHIGQFALCANGISFIFFGFYTAYYFLFLVMGKAVEGFLLGICRQGLCFIPIILILPGIAGLDGVILSQPIADIISAIITAAMAIPLHKKLNNIQQKHCDTAKTVISCECVEQYSARKGSKL